MMMILGKLHIGWVIAGSVVAFSFAMIFVLARALLRQERRLRDLTKGMASLHDSIGLTGDELFRTARQIEALESTLQNYGERQEFLEAQRANGARIENAISLLRRTGGDESVLECVGLNSGEAELLMRMQRRTEEAPTETLPRQVGSLRTLLGSMSGHPDDAGKPEPQTQDAAPV